MGCVQKKNDRIKLGIDLFDRLDADSPKRKIILDNLFEAYVNAAKEENVPNSDGTTPPENVPETQSDDSVLVSIDVDEGAESLV